LRRVDPPISRARKRKRPERAWHIACTGGDPAKSMKTFRCVCGGRVFFDNTQCLLCDRELGFLPEAGTLVGLEQATDGVHATPYGPYKKCENYAARGVCNWLVPADSPETLCRACRLNHVVPDLSNAENLALWAEIEKAKRRLIYTLDQLHLPVVSQRDDPQSGLAFDIKADTAESRVLTGHADGLITLNLGEADTVTREQARVAFKERYRTLLGHFRHEIGHYFWERLVRDGGRLELFREHFGDETRDYAQCLADHYAAPANTEWSDDFITAYASSHPWEDWAETFAHYLLMLDTLDTSREFGFAGAPSPELNLPGATEFDLLVDEWAELVLALNALNRSMGLPDPYPFSISKIVRDKLEIVHRIVREARAATLQAAPNESSAAPTELSRDEPSRTRIAV
jgi:hypothetical protein